MSVQINITHETSARELAAIACLIAVLRSDQPLPAPPIITFDNSDQPEREQQPAPAATAAPPPPAQPVSESLMAAEAARVEAAPPPRAQSAAAATGTVERDTEGLPWDARIHSTPATKNAGDGRWRAKRGLDDATKAAVTAELKAAAGPAGADPLPVTTEATASDAATAFGAGGAASASEAPPPPVTAAAPPPPAQAVATDPPPPVAATDPNAVTYPAIVTLANDKGMTYDALNEISVSLGLAKFAELAKRPDLFPMFVSAIAAWTPPAA
jgi:hypothetical protein